jgi:hypothetical protein
MIIQINATVCGCEDHGGDGWCKIAGSGQRGRRRKAWKRAIGQGKKKFSECGRTAGSSNDDGATTVRVKSTETQGSVAP